VKIRYQTREECTGLSASWCPNCGDCTCPRDEDGCVLQEGFDVVEDSACPLHGLRSKHGTPEPQATRLFLAEIIVGADRMLSVRGGNHTNRSWELDTLTEDLGDGEIDVTLVVRGRVRGELVPGTVGMGVRVDFRPGERKYEGT
jgi:hypothetical protein